MIRAGTAGYKFLYQHGAQLACPKITNVFKNSPQPLISSYHKTLGYLSDYSDEINKTVAIMVKPEIINWQAIKSYFETILQQQPIVVLSLQKAITQLYQADQSGALLGRYIDHLTKKPVYAYDVSAALLILKDSGMPEDLQQGFLGQISQGVERHSVYSSTQIAQQLVEIWRKSPPELLIAYLSQIPHFDKSFSEHNEALLYLLEADSSGALARQSFTTMMKHRPIPHIAAQLIVEFCRRGFDGGKACLNVGRCPTRALPDFQNFVTGHCKEADFGQTTAAVDQYLSEQCDLETQPSVIFSKIQGLLNQHQEIKDQKTTKNGKH